jgi:TatD DNase family protein
VIKLFDAGVNLFSNQFDQDRAEVVDRARQQGVHRLLLISSDLAETQLNQEYSNTFSGLYCTAGVHPHQAINVESGWHARLSKLLQQPRVVAVGECGLDFNRDFSPRQQQISVFEQQLELAKHCGKPVYLHERDAFDTQLELLQQHQIQHGVAHCFTGDQHQLKAYLDQGLYIGITGWLCDERRHQQLVQAMRYLPLDRLLLETDAPYLLPRTLQPKPKNRRNEPMYLTEVMHYLAQLVGKSAEEISTISWNNSCTLFNLPWQGRELDD